MDKTLYYLAPFRTSQQAHRDEFYFRRICGINALHGISSSVRHIAGRDDNGRLIRMEKEADRLLRIVADSLGLKTSCVPLPPFLSLSASERNFAEQHLAAAGHEVSVITLAPGSKMPAKRWPVERFLEVSKELLSLFPKVLFVVVGDETDFQAGEFLKEELKTNCINLAGRSSIMEAAAALSRADLHIGNDTGTMHLAAAVGVRTVTVFSARDNPGKWEPFGVGHRILRKSLPCEGCMRVECPLGNKCLAMISSREVINEAVAALKFSGVVA